MSVAIRLACKNSRSIFFYKAEKVLRGPNYDAAAGRTARITTPVLVSIAEARYLAIIRHTLAEGTFHLESSIMMFVELLRMLCTIFRVVFG